VTCRSKRSSSTNDRCRRELRRPPRPVRSTYSTVAITLHWLIAAGVLTNIGLAWYFTNLKGWPKSPAGAA